MVDRRPIRGVYFDGIVSAQPHAGELLVGKMLNHLKQTWVSPEEVVPEVSPALDEVFLVLTVGDLAHAADQQAVAVILYETVPVAAPNNLDYVPARPAENSLEFLNDLAIAAHRSVQPLQIAIHHEDQVIEPLPRSQGD